MLDEMKALEVILDKIRSIDWIRKLQEVMLLESAALSEQQTPFKVKYYHEINSEYESLLQIQITNPRFVWKEF